MNKYQPVIGLEVHVELKTTSKMFCSCKADYFGKTPNTHTCPVCLGLPGALPVPNKKAIEWCIMIGLALNCKINKFSKFDRKNYFYPDLSKGYQISQYDSPFGEHGSMTLSNGKKIGITRVHMEEDTGKLIHETVNGQKISLVDYNRSSVPLVEIVTEPDFDNADDVVEYLQKLQTIVRYLGVSNADMEKGDMRLEPNISLTDKPGVFPPYKVEVKTINSFKFVHKAISYELKRQEEILEKGETPLQETRGWNEAQNNTVSQRIKEEANDYRYFPEPDIPPITHTVEEIAQFKSSLPELREEKIKRFMTEFFLSEYDSSQMTREKDEADLFEDAVKIGKEKNITAKQIANFIMNKKDVVFLSSKELIALIETDLKKEELDPAELDAIIQSVLSQNEKAVTDYKSGKESVIMFLVGQCMRAIGKKVDARIITNLIKSHIHKNA